MSSIPFLGRFKNLGLFTREVIGWLLLLMGLYAFQKSFWQLDQRRVIEGFVAALIGVFLFRGGLQLVKVAVAARAFVEQKTIAAS